MPACKQLIREGLGVALLPESIIAADSAGLQTRDVVPAVSWEVALVARDGVEPSPATAAFMELVNSELRNDATRVADAAVDRRLTDGFGNDLMDLEVQDLGDQL